MCLPRALASWNSLTHHLRVKYVFERKTRKTELRSIAVYKSVLADSARSTRPSDRLVWPKSITSRNATGICAVTARGRPRTMPYAEKAYLRKHKDGPKSSNRLIGDGCRGPHRRVFGGFWHRPNARRGKPAGGARDIHPR